MRACMMGRRAGLRHIADRMSTACMNTVLCACRDCQLCFTRALRVEFSQQRAWARMAVPYTAVSPEFRLSGARLLVRSNTLA